MREGIKKISIIGAVRSGLAAAKLAQRMGLVPFVSDAAEYEKLKNNFDELVSLGIAYEAGGNTEKIYDCDLIVTSPGVPSDSKVLKEALVRGIEVVSELEFASWFCKGKIIGITGTNGKTTTATLCNHTLNQSGVKSYLAGNIGTAFSEIADSVADDEFVTLEISSFQLDYIKDFAPHIAVILNITPDHLDRYENSVEKYAASKFRITENQSTENYFIINGNDFNKYKPTISASVYLIDTRRTVEVGSYIRDNELVFSSANGEEVVCNWNDVNLKGEHNQQNTLAVTTIAKLLGLENEKIKNAFSSFQGVEHRLEFVRELNGVTFINDSKATNVDSVYFALQSFDKPLRLILGGKDKGNDYNQILDLVKDNVVKIYAIGSSANKVESFFSGSVPTEKYDSMEEAVTKAYNEAAEGEIVLLSPACASFDMFDNYEHRGKVFKTLVNSL